VGKGCTSNPVYISQEVVGSLIDGATECNKNSECIAFEYSRDGPSNTYSLLSNCDQVGDDTNADIYFTKDYSLPLPISGFPTGIVTNPSSFTVDWDPYGGGFINIDSSNFSKILIFECDLQIVSREWNEGKSMEGSKIFKTGGILFSARDESPCDLSTGLTKCNLVCSVGGFKFKSSYIFPGGYNSNTYTKIRLEINYTDFTISIKVGNNPIEKSERFPAIGSIFPGSTTQLGYIWDTSFFDSEPRYRIANVEGYTKIEENAPSPFTPCIGQQCNTLQFGANPGCCYSTHQTVTVNWPTITRENPLLIKFSITTTPEFPRNGYEIIRASTSGFQEEESGIVIYSENNKFMFRGLCNDIPDCRPCYLTGNEIENYVTNEFEILIDYPNRAVAWKINGQYYGASTSCLLNTSEECYGDDNPGFQTPDTWMGTSNNLIIMENSDRDGYFQISNFDLSLSQGDFTLKYRYGIQDFEYCVGSTIDTFLNTSRFGCEFECFNNPDCVATEYNYCDILNFELKKLLLRLLFVSFV